MHFGQRTAPAARGESPTHMSTPSIARYALLAVAVVLLLGCSAESKKTRRLERAETYYKAGDYEKSQIEYLNVLQIDPEDMTANERLALIWTERGSPLRAAPYLLKMKSVAPGNLALRLKLGQLMLALGKATEARGEALLVLNSSSSFPDALVLLTETARALDDYKVAEQALQKVADKDTTAFYIASANLMSLRGDAASAKAMLEKAVAREPKSPAAHSALAIFYAAQGNTTRALAEFKEAATLSPARSTARLQYAGALAQSGAAPDAIAYLTEITRQTPDYLAAWRGLADLALSQRKYDEAMAHLQTLFRRDPLDYESRILRAKVWLAQGETGKAIEDLERFGQDFPHLAVEKYQLAIAYLQSRDEGKAIAALREAVTQNPDSTDAILLLARLNFRAGDFQAAAFAMADLVTSRPGLTQAYPILIDSMRQLGRLDDAARVIAQNIKAAPRNAQLYYFLGLIRKEQNKPAEARQSFEHALAVSPVALPALTELVNADIAEGQFDLAMNRVRASMEKLPELAEPRFLEAKVYAAQRQWADMEAALLKTLKLDVKHAGAYALVADSFYARKEQANIFRHMEGLVAQLPDRELSALWVGQVYTRLGEFSAAKDLYEKCLSERPESAVILNNLAALYDEQINQPGRALELARKARKLDGTSPAIADTLGWILFKQKAYQEALSLLRESAAKLPQNGAIQYHLGMVNRALGQNEAARTAFRMAADTTGDASAKAEALRQLALLEGGASAK